MGRNLFIEELTTFTKKAKWKVSTFGLICCLELATPTKQDNHAHLRVLLFYPPKRVF